MTDWSLVQAVFDPPTRTVVRDVLVTSLPDDVAHRHFSAVAHPQTATDYFVATSTVSPDGFELSRRRVSGGGGQALVGAVLTVPTTDPLIGLAVCTTNDIGQPTGSVWVTYTPEGNETYASYWCDPAWTPEWTHEIVLVYGRDMVDLDIVYVDGGAPSVVVSGTMPGGLSGDGFDRIHYRSVSAATGIPVHPPYLVCALGERAARSFAWRGKAYLPVVMREVTPSGEVNRTGAIFHLAATDGYQPYRAPLVGTWGANTLPDFGRFALVAKTAPAAIPRSLGLYAGDAWTWACPSLVGTLQTQLDRVVVDAPQVVLPLPPTQAQGLAYLPGALTSCFDGERIFEAGFVQRPQIAEVLYFPGDGDVEPGTYLYIAEWEHFDALGNRHVSATSDVSTVEIGPGDPVRVQLRFQMDFATRRGDREDARDAGARLVVYRTQRDRSTPFYRIVSPTATSVATVDEPESLLENDPTVDTLLFSDTASDAAMLDRVWGLYTGNLAGAIPGAIQDPGVVPPSRYLLNTKSRVFGISGDDAKQIFFSRFFVPGEAPAFPPAFRIYLSDVDEEATALGALQDKLVVFTKGRAYYVYGEGPLDTGGGAGFSEPILFSDALGCINPASVCTTTAGLIFQGARDGLFLIDPGLSITRISGPIEDTLRNADLHAVYVDTARSWVVFVLDHAAGKPTHLVFSYLTGTWVRWAFDRPHQTTPSTGVLWRGRHVFGVSYPTWHGLVAYESGRWQDRSVNATIGEETTDVWADVQPSIQTPWLRVGALNGFQRVRRFALRGISTHEQDGSPLPADKADAIGITVEHDEEEGSGQTFRYTLTNVRGLPRLELQGHIARQKCSSVRVTIDLLDKGDTPGATLTALTLEIAGKPGFAKLSKQNKGPT